MKAAWLQHKERAARHLFEMGYTQNSAAFAIRKSKSSVSHALHGSNPNFTILHALLALGPAESFMRRKIRGLEKLQAEADARRAA